MINTSTFSNHSINKQTRFSHTHPDINPCDTKINSVSRRPPSEYNHQIQRHQSGIAQPRQFHTPMTERVRTFTKSTCSGPIHINRYSLKIQRRFYWSDASVKIKVRYWLKGVTGLSHEEIQNSPKNLLIEINRSLENKNINKVLKEIKKLTDAFLPSLEQLSSKTSSGDELQIKRFSPLFSLKKYVPSSSFDFLVSNLYQSAVAEMAVSNFEKALSLLKYAWECFKLGKFDGTELPVGRRLMICHLALSQCDEAIEISEFLMKRKELYEFQDQKLTEARFFNDMGVCLLLKALSYSKDNNASKPSLSLRLHLYFLIKDFSPSQTKSPADLNFYSFREKAKEMFTKAWEISYALSPDSADSALYATHIQICENVQEGAFYGNIGRFLMGEEFFAPLSLLKAVKKSLQHHETYTTSTYGLFLTLTRKGPAVVLRKIDTTHTRPVNTETLLKIAKFL